jgi:siroheme synthase
MDRFSERTEPASIFLIVTDLEDPYRVPWPAEAILHAADAVLYDGAIDNRILELTSPNCFREKLSEQPASSGLQHPAELTRIRQLAGQGWRLVRLVAGDRSAAAEVNRLEAAGVTVRVLSGPTRAADRPRPELFPTALNGLAG